MPMPRALAVTASLVSFVTPACSSPPAQDARPGAARALAAAPPWTPGDPRPPGPPDAAYRFWIGEVGPTGPLFSGPQQYPFICTTWENGLGQPLAEPGATKGSAVFPEVNGVPDWSADPVGRAPTCSIRTRVDYFYFSATGRTFRPMPPAAGDAIERITVGGKTIPFVVRLERGTINRFIYSIAMLAPYPEPLDSPAKLDNRAWNRKLVYSFQGGVAIGHVQGDFSLGRTAALHEQALRRGYAVAYSTGNIMDTHYNLVLAGETAFMVKNHFVATYGRPRYTVGVGGSGGSIQQYAIAQNLPGVLDALVPQYSYSDMVTQTIYVGDCELLERYFDASWTYSGHTSRWGRWSDRRLVEGLNTNDVATNQEWSGNPLPNPYAPTPGYSECIKGWRGLTPLAINPRWAPGFYFEALAKYRYPPEDVAAVKWTHWDDLGNVYPKDANGYAKITWDNVGVQYGLGALRRGELTPAEFLDLNACVGSWKDPDVMTANNFPWNPAAPFATIDPWSMEDMNLSPTCSTGTPAPRRAASPDAMHAAYESGHVFLGRLDLPIVDMRHYLDPVLDMHHAQQSFATRQRMIDAAGNADNQVVWFAECSTMNFVSLSRSCAFDPTGAAFDTIDRWIANIRENPERGVVGNKPPEAVDACFAGDGSLIYAGPDAWQGILDGAPAGPCTARFPLHTTSRIEAGGGIRGDVFKCGLEPVATALGDGTYGTLDMSGYAERLGQIFPTGVCDYTQPDQGRPQGI